MNTAIGAGRGMAGYTSGILEGFLGGITDALSGIWDLIKGIYGTISDIVTGEISSIEEIYREFTDMDWERASELVATLLLTLVTGAESFYANWTHADIYQKWNFRGRIVGNVLLEVVLAIFTAGAGNALRWIGRLGNVAPRLALVLRRALSRVERILPDNLRRRGDGRSDRGDRDPDRGDSLAMDKQRALLKGHHRGPRCARQPDSGTGDQSTGGEESVPCGGPFQPG